jgi:hypothetical protein
MSRLFGGLLLAVCFVCAASAVSVSGQQQLLKRPTPEIKRLSPTVVQIGSLQVDSAARELRAPGTLNQVTILEFVANTPRGLKEYESAITVDSDAATFNAALLLLGLDPARARVPTQHFDETPPAGDPVELWVEAVRPNKPLRFPVEELLWHQIDKRTLEPGPWVYTGSTMAQGQFLAEADGVLIGLVHSPAPLIENPRKGAVKAYGEVVLNPNLGLLAGARVTLIVKALDRTVRAVR